MSKKLSLGLFSFTCDEGCMITFLEILNEKFFDWLPYLEIKHSRVLKSEAPFKDLDLALVEGCISTPHERDKLKRIRKNTKKLVALGSCAITALPSGQKNLFDESKRKEIAGLVKKFHQLDQAYPLKEFVKVDEEIPGCPMDEEKFVEVMEKYLTEFGVK